jgi:hypothetical protein
MPEKTNAQQCHDQRETVRYSERDHLRYFDGQCCRPQQRSRVALCCPTAHWMLLALTACFVLFLLQCPKSNYGVLQRWRLTQNEVKASCTCSLFCSLVNALMFAYAYFYDSSMGHYTGNLVPCNERSLQRVRYRLLTLLILYYNSGLNLI